MRGLRRTTLAIVELREAYVSYFGIRDPDGVRVYIMERLGPAADKARQFLAPS